MAQKNNMRLTEKSYAIFALIVAGLGFADATYLTVEHFLGKVPPCSIIQGCELVTTSQYATIFGIPVALLGSLYYLAIIATVIFYIDQKNARPLVMAATFSVAGLVASLYFVGIQLFVLRAICLYCFFSATTSTLFFIASIWFLISKNFRA